MWYPIIGLILFIPFAYAFSKYEFESDERVLAAALGLLVACIWPAALLVLVGVIGVKVIERLAKGSRLNITWRNRER